MQILHHASDGAGTNGLDYNAVSGTLTFAEGIANRFLTAHRLRRHPLRQTRP